MNIGIFSGTFDPVHVGHVAFAQKAHDELNLEKIIFLPEPSPRRKFNVSVVKDREAMLRLTLKLKDWSEVHISDTSNHSVESTMHEIHKKYGKDNNYFILMGVDVYEHLESWPGYEQLLGENTVVLGLRTEDDGETAVEISSKLGINPRMMISPNPNLSSSKIRANLASDGIDESVQSYAKEHHLYE